MATKKLIISGGLNINGTLGDGTGDPVLTRDTTTKDIVSVFEDLQEIIKTGNLGNPYRYLGLRKGGK